MEDLVLGLVSGAALAVLLLRIVPRALRAWGLRVPRRMDDWMVEVEVTANACIVADLESARAKSRLVELIGQIPRDFDPSVFLACNIAEGIQRAVIFQAEQEGLIPAGVADRVYLPPADEPAPPPAYAAEEEPTNVRRLPSGKRAPRRVDRALGPR